MTLLNVIQVLCRHDTTLIDTTRGRLSVDVCLCGGEDRAYGWLHWNHWNRLLLGESKQASNTSNMSRGGRVRRWKRPLIEEWKLGLRTFMQIFFENMHSGSTELTQNSFHPSTYHHTNSNM